MLGGLIGGALGGLGKVLGGAAGAVTKILKNNPWVGSSAQALWNKREADTSYQRTMEDMKKAGLNPILAGKVGPLPAAQMTGLAETAMTARQLDTAENQLTINANESAARINKMSDEEKALEIDNELKKILLEYYRKHPNAAVWKDLGGRPIDKVTFGIAERILNFFLGKQNNSGDLIP